MFYNPPGNQARAESKALTEQQTEWRSLCFLRLHECDPDPGEAGRWVSGGSAICPLLLPEGPVGPLLTPSRAHRSNI